LEGIGEAGYACYALRRFRILPSVLMKMSLTERMFLYAVIDLEIAERDIVGGG